MATTRRVPAGSPTPPPPQGASASAGTSSGSGSAPTHPADALEAAAVEAYAGK